MSGSPHPTPERRKLKRLSPFQHQVEKSGLKVRVCAYVRGSKGRGIGKGRKYRGGLEYIYIYYEGGFKVEPADFNFTAP